MFSLKENQRGRRESGLDRVEWGENRNDPEVRVENWFGRGNWEENGVDHEGWQGTASDQEESGAWEGEARAGSRRGSRTKAC